MPRTKAISKRKPRKAPPPRPEPAAPAGETLEASFPIVGIGASAGGLEAFRLLLQNLPADTGAAFVLVQHLAPTHESIRVAPSAALLARKQDRPDAQARVRRDPS